MVSARRAIGVVAVAVGFAGCVREIPAELLGTSASGGSGGADASGGGSGSGGSSGSAGADGSAGASGSGSGSGGASGAAGAAVVCPAVLFDRTDYEGGPSPTGAAIGDLDHDGKADLAISDMLGTYDQVSVLIGDGHGVFAAPQNLTAGTSPVAVAVRDLNKDTRDDLVVLNILSKDASVFLGNAANWLGSPVSSGVGSGEGPSALAIDDIDGDLKLDLAVAVYNGDQVSVLFGKGNGSAFEPPHVETVTGAPTDVAVGDFDGINGLDLAVSCQTSHDLAVLLNNGDRTFAAPFRYPGMNNPSAVVVDDFDGDHVLDIVVGNATGASVSVLLGKGDGSFSSPTEFDSPSGPADVASADFDHDGKPDLVTVATFYDNLSLLMNLGGGTFAAPINLPSIDPTGLAVGDVNGDGWADIVVVNYDAKLSVYISTCGQQ